MYPWSTGERASVKLGNARIIDDDNCDWPCVSGLLERCQILGRSSAKDRCGLEQAVGANDRQRRDS